MVGTRAETHKLSFPAKVPYCSWIVCEGKSSLFDPAVEWLVGMGLELERFGCVEKTGYRVTRDYSRCETCFLESKFWIEKSASVFPELG